MVACVQARTMVLVLAIVHTWKGRVTLAKVALEPCCYLREFLEI